MSPKLQRGLSMIFAVFLVVCVAAVAGVMARMVGGANLGAAQDVLGTQARQAALAGLEVGLYQWIQGGGTAWCDSQGATGALMSSVPVSGYQVLIQCTRGSNDLNGTSLATARIVATACSGSGSCPDTTTPNRPGYVERRVETFATR